MAFWQVTTRGHLVPNVALYQAEPHAVKKDLSTFYIADIPVICENINVIVLKTTLQIIHFLKICVNHRRNIYGLSKTEEDER